jgi:outer membrane autotransporter protein
MQRLHEEASTWCLRMSPVQACPARACLRARAMLASIIGVISIVASAESAMAQCVPDPPASGDTVTCSGNIPTYTTTGLNTLTIQVLGGTNFNGPFAASIMSQLSMVNQGNMQDLTFDTINNLSFENTGNINNGITLLGLGTHVVINRAGGNINQSFAITGDGADTIINEGTINPGIQKTGAGTLSILNAMGATINQFITVIGSSQTSIDNSGTIQSAITLGSGNDFIVNRDPGTINGTVDQGTGADTFQMLGGRVNGEIQQGDGTDQTLIASGEITGFVRAGAANDTLLWNGGLVGGIDMGSGTDRATFQNLTQTHLRGILIDGGPGAGDTLTWSNVQGEMPQRLVNWELIELTNASTLKMGGNLTLGDSGALTGALTIDPSSTLFSGEGQHSIVPFAVGQLVSVSNAGTIDLTNGPASATDSLSIRGNYIGQGGRLLLNTVLESDGAPSDKLIIDTGQATGVTGIFVSNLNGAGAETQANGILVVDAINGATTTSGAFSLLNPGGYAAAGPYAYTLFRGSVDASNPNAWYLRSTVDCSADPTNAACGDGGGGVGGGGNGGGRFRPNFRPEVSLYAAIPSLALLYGRTLLDTLHQRVGEQEHLRARRDLGSSATNNGQWGRVVVLDGNRDGHRLGIFRDGPAYDYTFAAVQVGQDIYRAEQPNGFRDHVGVLGAIGHGRGDVDHIRRLRAGRDSFMAYTAGGYWTRFGPTGWYIDNVLQGTWYDVEAVSGRLPNMEVKGGGLGASLEAGYPIHLGAGWMIEPQAQAVYQLVGLGNANDTAATVKFQNVESLAGRLGVRFANTWMGNGAVVTAWLRPNLWREFEGDPRTAFSSAIGFIPFRSDISGSWAEFNTGVSLQLNRTTSLFTNASYQVGLDGRSEAWDAKIGGRVNW